MLLRNVSPLGAVSVAGYGLVEAGAKFAVNAADVAGLIGQVENFEPADDEASAARAAHLAPIEPDEPDLDDPAANVSLIKNEAQ